MDKKKLAALGTSALLSYGAGPVVLYKHSVSIIHIIYDDMPLAVFLHAFCKGEMTELQ